MGNTSATTTESLLVTVAAVADTPTLDSVDVNAGNAVLEDTTVDLDIQAALSDTDGSEALSIHVSGLNGATLSAGQLQSDGSYLLTESDLSGLTLTPPVDFSGTLNVVVTATSTESSNSDTASSAPITVPVDIEAVAGCTESERHRSKW